MWFSKACNPSFDTQIQIFMKKCIRWHICICMTSQINAFRFQSCRKMIAKFSVRGLPLAVKLKIPQKCFAGLSASSGYVFYYFWNKMVRNTLLWRSLRLALRAETSFQRKCIFRKCATLIWHSNPIYHENSYSLASLYMCDEPNKCIYISKLWKNGCQI